MDGVDVNSTNSTNDSSPSLCDVYLNDYCEPDGDYMDRIMQRVVPEPHEWFFIFCYAVVFFVGLIGNISVCLAVWRNPLMRTVTNYFIVNLALADCLVLILCLLPTMIMDVSESWLFGEAMCKVVLFFQTTAVAVSVLTLTAVSVERWYAICRPLKFKSTPRRAKIIIVIVWIISACASCPELIVLETERLVSSHYSDFLIRCEAKWDDTSEMVYRIFIFVALYVLPLIVITISYIMVAKKLWRSRLDNFASASSEDSREQRPMQSGGISNSAQAEQQMKGRRKAAKMLIVVVIIFSVCYFPVHLINLLKYMGALKEFRGVAVTIVFFLAHWLCYFNSAINPVIYNFMSEKFRREFTAAYRCCLCKKPAANKMASGRGVSRPLQPLVRRHERGAVELASMSTLEEGKRLY